MTASNPDPSSKLLIVDDEVPLRTLFSMALESDQYNTETAANGREALDALKVQTFDLILLDLSMPGLTGLDVLREMRARRDFTKVVIVSAYIPGAAVLKAVSMGVTQFLKKPMKLPFLRDLVSQQLQWIGSSPLARAKMAARKLDFKTAASELRESKSSLDLQSSVWLELFENLSAGKTIHDLDNLIPKLKLLVNS